jgi:hypothetical protein
MMQMNRRSFGFVLAGTARAAASSIQPLKVTLGPQQPVAAGVPWPYLVQLRDGTTILLGHVRWPKGGTYPIHYTAVSRDGRKTWTEWKPSSNQGSGPITEGSAVELRSGPLLVFDVHAEHIGNKVFERNYWITKDSYRTLEGPLKYRFSLPEAAVDEHDDRGFPISRMYFRRSVIELENGDLLACAYGHFESDRFPSEYRATMNKTRSFLLRSSNRSNWNYVGTIASDPYGQEGSGEPVLVRLTRGPRKGRLICLFRTGRENPIYQCESDDEGRTWTRAYPLSWQYSKFGRRRDIVGTDPDVIEMQDGTLVMSFGHKPDFQEDGNFLAFSIDQGQSWTQVTRLSSSPTVAYTGVREVAPGELFVAYSVKSQGDPGYDTVARSISVKAL